MLKVKGLKIACAATASAFLMMSHTVIAETPEEKGRAIYEEMD